jgi:hypothetical protein
MGEKVLLDRYSRPCSAPSVSFEKRLYSDPQETNADQKGVTVGPATAPQHLRLLAWNTLESGVFLLPVMPPVASWSSRNVSHFSPFYIGKGFKCAKNKTTVSLDNMYSFGDCGGWGKLSNRGRKR